jgi:hypothetical protein
LRVRLVLRSQRHQIWFSRRKKKRSTNPRFGLAGAIRLLRVTVPTVEALVATRHVRRVGHRLGVVTGGSLGDLGGRGLVGWGRARTTVVGGGGSGGRGQGDHRDTIGDLSNGCASQGETEDY